MCIGDSQEANSHAGVSGFPFPWNGAGDALVIVSRRQAWFDSHLGGQGAHGVGVTHRIGGYITVLYLIIWACGFWCDDDLLTIM